MKKVLIILIILILSSCSKSIDIEACRTNFSFRSYAYDGSIDECSTIYNKIDKSKSIIDPNSMVDGNSIQIHFEFEDSNIENYFLNPDGTLLYDIENVQYSLKMDTEFYTQLKNNLE